jgi:hypothetical protein
VDPRLADIDLTGRIRRTTIRVLDSDGAGLVNPDAMVLVDEAGAGELRGSIVREGAASILTLDPFVNLLVLAKGYMPKVLAGVTTDTEVRLEEFPVVTMRLSGGPTVLPPGHKLWISLQEEGRVRDSRSYDNNHRTGRLEEYLRPTFATRSMDGQGRVILAVRGAGTYSLHMALENDPNSRSTEIDSFEPRRVDVRLGRSLSYSVRIPPEAISAAVERIRDR